MKRFIYIFFFAMLSAMSFSQVVSFDLSDTALSAEEVKAKTGNAVKLIYPTSMKSKIPAMECNVQVDDLGPFSVAEGRQVIFAPGNLQFNAALGTHQCADGTTQKGTWRFAEHQWNYVGDSINGNVYIVVGTDSTKCNNANISATYDGWIDLFGWGTSGWNSGAVAYQPWSTSESYSDYYPGGNYKNDITGAYANADWGVYNQIGSDAPCTWRTLTYDEWNYVLNGRANADNLKGQATVNGVTGFILLPDDWVTPEGISFTAGASLEFTANTYTESQWKQMEQHGAVFLPSGGHRNGSSVNNVRSGIFWSASQFSSDNAGELYFKSGYLNMVIDDRHIGKSVRLSQDL